MKTNTVPHNPADNPHMLMQFNLPQRFLISFLLCIPVFIINFGGNFLGWEEYLPLKTAYQLQMIFSLVIVWGCGSFLFSRALKSITSRSLNMFTLVGLAVSLTWFYSLFALWLPQDFPPAFHNKEGVVPVYFDAASYITMFVILGQYLELKAKMQVNNELLRNLNANYADNQIAVIRELIKNAHRGQIPLTRLINRLSQWLVALIVLLAVAAFAFWESQGPQPSAVYGLIIALSILLAGSPCALALAVPLSITIGLNHAAAQGILINNPDLIEKIHHHHNVKDLIASGKIILLKHQKPAELAAADIILTPKAHNAECSLFFLADKIMHNIYENFALGLAYNIIFIPIAAGILYPFSGFLLGPVTAAAAMSLSSLIVILNALRLREQLPGA